MNPVVIALTALMLSLGIAYANPPGGTATGGTSVSTTVRLQRGGGALTATFVQAEEAAVVTLFREVPEGSLANVSD